MIMKNGISFILDDARLQAFDEIKVYLTKPPVLVAPELSRSFLIYVISWIILSVLY